MCHRNRLAGLRTQFSTTKPCIGLCYIAKLHRERQRATREKNAKKAKEM